MPDKIQSVELAESLAGVAESAFASALGADWNERENTAYENISRVLPDSSFAREDVYLGGDSLRPYLTLRTNGDVFAVARERIGLTRPRLLVEIDSGKYGTVQRIVGKPVTSQTVVSVPTSSGLILDRLDIPSVYLVSLTDASRYQTRRYPLNVGRLGQWLRFQHAGRVTATDLALDFEGDLKALCEDIVSSKPDILGVSLNFGELASLGEIVSAVRAADQKPTICVGNVLAAWAPEEVARICADFHLFISRSYGESDLERICLSFRRLPFAENELQANAQTGPVAIVLPDERLLVDTLKQGGQASIETSFGCQFSGCTFCPRDHRGKDWNRPAPLDAVAVAESMASLIATSGDKPAGVLSFVDEEAFGKEGLEPGDRQPVIVTLVNAVGAHKVACEIYTRIEQIYDRQRKESDSLRRLRQLSQMRSSLARVFVGVESGSNSQLRRYGKGQSTRDVVDALRAGSLLGLPMEFGFITFDPLLTQEELIENLEFLARSDILFPQSSVSSIEEIYEILISDGQGALPQGDLIFNRVAYMATELELFANSAYFKRLSFTHPRLIGAYDGSFARYDYSYQDPVIGQIASWCRVWTEGTFRAIYKMRLASRALRSESTPLQEVIGRYRAATFSLLLSLTKRFSGISKSRLAAVSRAYPSELPLDDDIDIDSLTLLWQWIVSAPVLFETTEKPGFSLESLERRRET
jgi:hypothetical protein